MNQALPNGTCLVCGALREFQSGSEEEIQIAAEMRLGNFHTWLLAGLAPAKQVSGFRLDDAGAMLTCQGGIFGVRLLSPHPPGGECSSARAR